LASKAHIGVDAYSALMHVVRGTVANVMDAVEANARQWIHKQPTLVLQEQLEQLKSKIRGRGQTSIPSDQTTV
jgi:hypothetical protein